MKEKASGKTMKRMFCISLGCMLLMSASLLFMPYASHMAVKGSEQLLIVAGLMFWVPSICGYVLLFLINNARKRGTRKKKEPVKIKDIGIFRVFSNKWAYIVDSAFGLSVIGLFILVATGTNGYSVFVFAFFVLLTFQGHCMLNGKNYRFVFQ